MQAAPAVCFSITREGGGGDWCRQSHLCGLVYHRECVGAGNPSCGLVYHRECVGAGKPSCGLVYHRECFGAGNPSCGLV